MLTLKRPHYAWIICLAGAMSFCVGIGLVTTLFSLCLPDIILKHGLTNAQGSWLTTIRSLFSLSTMLVINRLCRRFGLRTVMSVGCLMSAAGYFGLSRANSFLECCLCCVLTGISHCMCGSVPVSLLMRRWFDSRRNLALGLSAAGSGVIAIVAPPLVTQVKSNFGLPAAFLTLSGMALTLAILLWLLIRNQPEDLSMTPYRENENAVRNTPVRAVPPAMSPLQKGSVYLATFLMAATAGPGYSYIAVFFRSEHYSEMTVAALISTIGFVILVGKILSGQIYDRLGGRCGNYYTYGMLVAGHVLFWFVPLGITALAFLSIIVYGMGIHIATVSIAKWAADLNSDEDYAEAVRSINMASALGSLSFGPVPGILADHFGSCLPGYTLFAILLVVSFVLLHTVYCQLGVGKRF